MFSRDSIGTMRRNLEETRDKIEMDREEIRKSGVALEAAAARKDELARQEAVGDISAQASAKGFEETEAMIRRHLSERERFERLIVAREQEIVRIQSEIERSRYEVVLGERDHAAAPWLKHAQKYAAALRGVETAGASLVKHRGRVAERDARALALKPDSVDHRGLPDEPEWPDVAEIIRLLEGGPERPNAATAAAIEKQREQTKDREESQVRDAVAAMLTGFFEHALRVTPAHLYEEAFDGYERALKAELAKSQTDERRRWAADVGIDLVADMR
jgi:hypothetical protein